MLDVMVIGGGQAGLAMGYVLQQAGVRFQILEASGRVGDAWRSRYASLVLFTPAKRDALPGLPFPGDPERYPTKDDVADYLEAYAREFALPVRLNTRVTGVRRVGGAFEVSTAREVRRTRAVVVATGPFQVPFIPSLAQGLAAEVVQVHSSAYQHPAQLPPGRVVVVGSGNSGAQIAAELARTHEVILALGRHQPQLPQRVLGRDIFDVLSVLGFFEVPTASWLGRFLRRRDPVIGTDIRHLARSGRVQLMARVTGAEGRTVRSMDGQLVEVDAVVWATGFRPDYRWLDVGVLDAQGRPRHVGGVGAVPGVYFLGLSWQRSRASALLGGVGRDAQALGTQVIHGLARGELLGLEQT
ncbi:flavin-containing monooxygenase [Deinococcus antarcticus]|uniref:Flavin-containing monooxygenase n=1 Tax=Deinococcus antarcticus TaxID=1298767 RepID=A0ABV8AB83_9DEIO